MESQMSPWGNRERLAWVIEKKNLKGFLVFVENYSKTKHMYANIQSFSFTKLHVFSL